MDHVTDGAELLRKHRLPKEIIDIAEQHHGTTLLKYFYQKVKQSGEEVTEEEIDIQVLKHKQRNQPLLELRIV